MTKIDFKNIVQMGICVLIGNIPGILVLIFNAPQLGYLYFVSIATFQMAIFYEIDNKKVGDTEAENVERIICSANYYNDNISHPNQPFGIETGFVLCGLRHHNCISTFQALTKDMDEKSRNLLRTYMIQGFLTNKHRFVSREEAMKIAIKANQVKESKLHAKHIGLFSEDLY